MTIYVIYAICRKPEHGRHGNPLSWSLTMTQIHHPGTALVTGASSGIGAL